MTKRNKQEFGAIALLWILAILVLSTSYKAHGAEIEKLPDGVASPDDVIFEAISHVESNGNPKARAAGEDAVGLVQIRKILVRDVNRILGKEKYSLDDRWSPEKSREMFNVYLSHYALHLHRNGKTVTYKTLAGLWNCGPTNYATAETNGYWAKVEKRLKEKGVTP